MYDVTVIGAGLIDILAAPVNPEETVKSLGPMDAIRMSYGGDALNESVVLSRLGFRVQLISRIGDDEAGSMILHHLQECGISGDSVAVEKGMSTSVNIALVGSDGSRRFLTDPHSSLRQLRIEDVLPALADSAQIVCFASMFVSPLFTIEAMKDLFARIKAMGKTLVVDVTSAKNGEKLEDLRELLPYIDVFVPNDEEISSLTGDKDPVRNAERLVEAGVKTAVVKTGGDGCVVATREGVTCVPSVPGVRCLDTTGAGDTFAAGFITGLCEGKTPVECARLGCAAASCSIEVIGATDGVLSRDQVMERLAKIPV